MGNYTIEIDEEEIKQIVIDKLTNSIVTDLKRRVLHSTDTAKIIKEVIYTNKDLIIESVTERATIEVSKKSIPKLLDKLAKEE